MKMWFYVKSTDALRTLEDGTTEKIHPYVSKMKEMKPVYKVDPLVEVSKVRKACDKAFVLACRYSGGRDLVEEMVASDFWPLGHKNEEFNIEMVQVPILVLRRGFLSPGLVGRWWRVRLRSLSLTALRPLPGESCAKSLNASLLRGGPHWAPCHGSTVFLKN